MSRRTSQTAARRGGVESIVRPRDALGRFLPSVSYRQGGANLYENLMDPHMTPVRPRHAAKPALPRRRGGRVEINSRWVDIDPGCPVHGQYAARKTASGRIGRKGGEGEGHAEGQPSTATAPATDCGKLNRSLKVRNSGKTTRFVRVYEMGVTTFCTSGCVSRTIEPLSAVYEIPGVDTSQNAERQKLRAEAVSRICYRWGNIGFGHVTRLYWRDKKDELPDIMTKSLNENSNRIRTGIETTDVGKEVNVGGGCPNCTPSKKHRGGARQTTRATGRRPVKSKIAGTRRTPRLRY
jgi:hypothetical protein